MLNEDNKSLIVDVPKKRIYSKKLIVPQKNNRQKCLRSYSKDLSDVKQKMYDLPTEVSLPISKLKKPEILLPYKHYCKQQDRNRYKQSLSINIYDKYKIIYNDLKNRLHVDYPLNDVCSVIDVDADYYSFLKSQLLPLNLIYKTVKESMNNILQLKYETGIKKDCTLNIETNYRNELNIYNLSARRLTQQARYFDAFISEDYKKSMAYLTKWDKLKTHLDLKMKELQNYGTEKFTLQSRLIGLEYKYSVQIKYGRFLYYLSPPIWRLNNREFARSIDIEVKGFDYGNSLEEDTFGIIFEKLHSICYGTPIKPVLYFTQPEDLMNIFKTMENQQLHYYTHVNHLTPHAKMFKKEIKALKEVMSQDYAAVVNTIKKYEHMIKFSEDKCMQLEDTFYKILYKLFYNSVGAPDILKLITHLEFCYEKVFLEKPMNIDITVLAKCLETFYMDYSKRLDGIQSSTVRRAMAKCIETERLKVKKANHAAKELRLFHRLEQTLLKAYGIGTDNLYIPIKLNSAKNKNNYSKNKTHQGHTSSRKQIPKEKEILTEVEKEYLLLFTEWTETEDPANYLQSLSKCYGTGNEDKPCTIINK